MAEGSGAGEAASGEIKLEFTSTWIVAAVCFIIILVSLFVERLLHLLGKVLKRKNQKPLFDALQKVKEELMLLGFISLLLTVLQGTIQKICIPQGWTRHMLPCKREDSADNHGTTHFQVVFSVGIYGGHRRLLSGGGSEESHCLNKGKVPLLSLEAIHQLHIFIFVLAVTHVAFSALTMLLGGAKIRQWKQWEESIQQETIENGVAPKRVVHVNQFQFIRDHFKGIGAVSVIISWLHSFVKQFYGSVTKSDYTTMRLGFIKTHCRANPKFDFHKYMIRALEADFKRVVGLSWYLWVFVFIFLLLNVNGWHTYFWISFIPLFLLLAIGTKLEHVITQLAHEVAEKHSAIEGDLVVNPSDDHFWFHRPRIVLYLIHFILFQNAFEIAFFFWILTAYGFNSCMMDRVGFIVPRLVIGVIIQLLCSYSTLPLYAIVTQMGSYFKKAIFDEHVQKGILGWAQNVKKRKGGNVGNGLAKTNKSENESSRQVEMERQDGQRAVSKLEEGSAGVN